MNRKEKTAVLVFRTGQLGDTLVALPALRAIRSIHPADDVILLTDVHPTRAWVFSGDVVMQSGLADQVLSYEIGGAWSRRAASLARTASRLWTANIRSIYSLTHSRGRFRRVRDRLLLTLLARCNQFYEAPQLAAPADRPVAAEWMRLVMTVPGSQREFEPPYLIPSERDIAGAQRTLELAGIPSHLRLIAIGPGSKMPAKIWPKERFISLTDRILDRHSGVGLVVLGGAEDRQLGEEISARHPNACWNFAGSTSIIQSLTLLHRCVAYVGNDTGTMHLAAAAGTSCVAIFSARDLPGKWEPYGRGHVIIRKSVPCSGCMLEECTVEAKRCLTSITVDEVLQGLEQILHDQFSRKNLERA
jgi:heptosyltransferase-3